MAPRKLPSSESLQLFERCEVKYSGAGFSKSLTTSAHFLDHKRKTKKSVSVSTSFKTRTKKEKLDISATDMRSNMHLHLFESDEEQALGNALGASQHGVQARCITL